MMQIPIRVCRYGEAAGEFSEETHTVLVNRDGGLIRLKQRVAPDQTLRLTNLLNYREADFRVVGQARAESEGITQWGVECLEPDRSIWEVEFPPPMNAESEKAAALLRCRLCGKEVLNVLSLTEVDILDSAGRLERLCDLCGQLTPWEYSDGTRRPPAEPARPSGPAAEQRTAAKPLLTPAPPKPEAWDRATERRLKKRMPLKLPVRVRNASDETEIAKTENISKGGLGVTLQMRLNVGDLVRIECPYSATGEHIEQRAEVRRVIPICKGRTWLYGLRYTPE